MSTGNIIRGRFVKLITPLRLPNLTTNTQECADSVQFSYGYKAEEINEIARRIIVLTEVKKRKDDPMIVLQ